MALLIKRQTVRARLTVLGDIRAFVATLLEKHGEGAVSVRRIFVDRVAVGVAEEQITAFAIPHWAFGEFEDLQVRRNDRVDRRIFAYDFHIDLAGRDCDRYNAAFVKLELRLAHVDIIGRRVRERPIDTKNRELDFLSRLDAPIDDQPIRRVPTSDD